MRQLSFKPTSATTAKHRATANRTKTKTTTAAFLGLLMAAPGFWIQSVHAAPDANLNHNNLEAKSLNTDSSSSILVEKDDTGIHARYIHPRDDTWQMPVERFYDHYLDPYWAERDQSSAHGRSSLVGMSMSNSVMKHGKRTKPVYDSGKYFPFHPCPFPTYLGTSSNAD